MLRFSKTSFSWRRTIYVLGLPRSGKTTFLNLIASCRNVFAVDEPFELQVIAQKGGEYRPGSEIYCDFADSYAICMENYFSELVLGRRFNFRAQDRSCIYNYKETEEVSASLNRRRRSDVVAYSSANDCAFAIAHNDVEKAVGLVTSGMPFPSVVYVERDVQEVSAEIKDRGWFSDEQLRTLANVSPAYGAMVFSNGHRLFVPYAISQEAIDQFVKGDDGERANLFVVAKQAGLRAALAEHDALPCLTVSLDELHAQPEQTFDRVARFGGLEMTRKTEDLIAAIFHRRPASRLDMPSLTSSSE